MEDEGTLRLRRIGLSMKASSCSSSSVPNSMLGWLTVILVIIITGTLPVRYWVLVAEHAADVSTEHLW